MDLLQGVTVVTVGPQYDFLPKNHLYRSCIPTVLYRRAIGRAEIRGRRRQANNFELLKTDIFYTFFGLRQVGETF
jgi:hypothetical protein